MGLTPEQQHYKVFPEHVAKRRAKKERVRVAAVEAVRKRKRQSRSDRAS